SYQSLKQSVCLHKGFLCLDPLQRIHISHQSSFCSLASHVPTGEECGTSCHLIQTPARPTYVYHPLQSHCAASHYFPCLDRSQSHTGQHKSHRKGSASPLRSCRKQGLKNSPATH